MYQRLANTAKNPDDRYNANQPFVLGTAVATKVFISSTCYDLLDVRAELERELTLMGLKSIMSDRPTSEFQVQLDANSIESCLTNVRNADVVLVILHRLRLALGEIVLWVASPESQQKLRFPSHLFPLTGLPWQRLNF